MEDDPKENDSKIIEELNKLFNKNTDPINSTNEIELISLSSSNQKNTIEDQLSFLNSSDDESTIDLEFGNEIYGQNLNTKIHKINSTSKSSTKNQQILEKSSGNKFFDENEIRFKLDDESLAKNQFNNGTGNQVNSNLIFRLDLKLKDSIVNSLIESTSFLRNQAIIDKEKKEKLIKLNGDLISQLTKLVLPKSIQPYKEIPENILKLNYKIEKIIDQLSANFFLEISYEFKTKIIDLLHSNKRVLALYHSLQSKDARKNLIDDKHNLAELLRPVRSVDDLILDPNPCFSEQPVNKELIKSDLLLSEDENESDNKVIYRRKTKKFASSSANTRLPVEVKKVDQKDSMIKVNVLLKNVKRFIKNDGLFFSEDFVFKEIKWYIEIKTSNIKQKDRTYKYINFNLGTKDHLRYSNFKCDAHFELRLISKSPGISNHFVKFDFKFRKNHQCGSARFISLAKINKFFKNFLSNDTFHFQVFLHVKEVFRIREN